MVRHDQGPIGMNGNFESTSSCALPYDLVAKRKSAGYKRDYAPLSEPNAEMSYSLVVPKLSIVKTGAQFRCYEQDDFTTF